MIDSWIDDNFMLKLIIINIIIIIIMSKNRGNRVRELDRLGQRDDCNVVVLSKRNILSRIYKLMYKVFLYIYVCIYLYVTQILQEEEEEANTGKSRQLMRTVKGWKSAKVMITRPSTPSFKSQTLSPRINVDKR